MVSKDLPMRVKASAMGLAADEYRNEWVTDSGWTGLEYIEATTGQLGQLYDGERIELDDANDLPTNTGLVISSGNSSALGRVKTDATSINMSKWSVGTATSWAARSLTNNVWPLICCWTATSSRWVAAPEPVSRSGLVCWTRSCPGTRRHKNHCFSPPTPSGPRAWLLARQRRRENEPVGPGCLRHRVR